jgi:uncharacterized membrane protein YphA (DoxX/SURF4 family)
MGAIWSKGTSKRSCSTNARHRRFQGFLAPFKFSPVGILGWPSYYVKFVQWGYPAWFSPVVGGVEIVAAVLLLLPRRRFLGAGILVLLMTGAVTTSRHR